MFTGINRADVSLLLPSRCTNTFFSVLVSKTKSLGILCTNSLVYGPLPFEYVAGKGVEPGSFARRLESLGLAGVSCSPYFSKKKSGFGGARMKLDLGAVRDLAALDVHLMEELHRALKARGGSVFAGSSKSELDVFYKVYGSDRIRRDIEQGRPAEEIARSWAPGLSRFRARRKKYLLYPA